MDFLMLSRLLFFFALSFCALAVAAPEDFYSARVPVDDRSEAALGDAAAQALAEVLIRVSGDEAVVTLPDIEAAVADARNRMSLYSYEDTDEGVVLFAQFDGNLIKGLLRRSGATFWAESRPPVLLWMVVDEPYSRRFATVSEDGQLLKSLASKFAERGVRLRLPLLDLEDAAALSPEMVWQKVMPRIQAASERYGTEHVLVGRYVQLSTGQQIADWLYLDMDDTRDLQLQGRDPEPILASAVDMVVDEMAERYAVRLEPVTTFDRIAVSINGVRSYSDYRGVLSVLNDITVLDGVQVSAVDGDRLDLKVVGVGSADALARLLPAKSRLAVVGDVDGRALTLNWGQP